MTPEQYMQEAPRTESFVYDVENPRIEHAIIGISTEAGELLDALKKQKFYGKDLDKVNLKEEGGDILWYLALLFDALGTDFGTEMQRNIDKLKTRFPEKFTQDAAFDRDLDKERETLEK